MCNPANRVMQTSVLVLLVPSPDKWGGLMTRREFGRKSAVKTRRCKIADQDCFAAMLEIEAELLLPTS